MIKVLLANGSPLKEGCTHTALCEVGNALNGCGVDADLFWIGNRFYLKPAAAVLSARRAGTTASWDQLNKYFGLMQMPIITSRYWNMVHGTAPEEVRLDLEGMQTVRVLGRNMAFFLRYKEVALAHGLEFPVQEPFQFTNFIR